jgi:pyruvate dehydrogenase E1 component alpha subunit
VLFVCEDNTFSAFTHSSTTTAGPGPLARAESCGVSGERVDGNDVLAVHEAALRLSSEARAGGGPRFLWAKTYRFSGHVSVDPAAYRSQADLDAALAHDPLALARAKLAKAGLPEADIAALDSEVQADILRSQARARMLPYPHRAQAFMDVQDMGAPS